MKLYIDFDGTIVNSSKRLIEMLNEKTGLSVGYKDRMNYWVHDKYPNVSREEVLDIFRSPLFFENLEIFDGFDFSNFTIVTIGTKENLELKEIWCKENLNPHTFIGLQKTDTGKKEIDMSDGIFIDDLTENLRSCNAKHKILFAPWATTWNEIGEHDNDLLIAESWEEAKKHISAISNNKGEKL